MIYWREWVKSIKSTNYINFNKYTRKSILLVLSLNGLVLYGSKNICLENIMGKGKETSLISLRIWQNDKLKTKHVQHAQDVLENVCTEIVNLYSSLRMLTIYVVQWGIHQTYHCPMWRSYSLGAVTFKISSFLLSNFVREYTCGRPWCLLFLKGEFFLVKLLLY